MYRFDRFSVSLSTLCLWLIGFLANGTGLVAQETAEQIERSMKQFAVHPELKLELFAFEPMLTNPSNIDVDHRGRVWVCEIINYRQFRNQDSNPREAGDRILILEDSDGDGRADKQTVFYQGRDIDSVHGICVLGDRVLVSANDSVFYLIDTDGDSKADKKEVLFTGIQGVQHDHGIHAFIFGPDGKLYFNFGNEGRSIRDKNNQPIIDMAGNEVVANRQPYNQGMVFRCNLDGSDFETLGWNFRNNWEVCVDSFGSMWQSDNDDDGNRATRINFVIPFGNYGFTDQKTGAGWRTERTGMHPDVPLRHWHQNDPGVIPNLLQTGAGSPTGICLYEGSLLPSAFQNQIIHTDAGPNVVRAYPVAKSGAGYSAKLIPLVDGAKENQWFRPSDVCVAPDGSLIVADWHDPGVGGHRMADIERGRLFRISNLSKPSKYLAPPVDFSTPRGAVTALSSPNLATRFLAWQALAGFGKDALTPLQELFSESDNPRFRARALWAIGKLDLPLEQRKPIMVEALHDVDPDIQVAAIRLCVQLRKEIPFDTFAQWMDLSKDLAPEVRREILIGMRQWEMDSEARAKLWATMASQYQVGDRWMLESLGIAADSDWDSSLAALFDDREDPLSDSAFRDIVWRSRGQQTAKLLASAILIESQLANTDVKQLARYFRAFDFLEPSERSVALANLAFNESSLPRDIQSFITLEAASRIDRSDLDDIQLIKLASMIEAQKGTRNYVELVRRFKYEQAYGDLIQLAQTVDDRQLAADAIRVVLDHGKPGNVHFAVISAEEPVRIKLCDALVNCGNQKACSLLKGVALRKDLNSEIRTYAVKRLGELRMGAKMVAEWIDQPDVVDAVIQPAVVAAMHASNDREVKAKAMQRFPIAQSKDNRPLPSIDELVKRKGDVANGKAIFENVGTCAKCHVVAGKGLEVGPDLSEIGTKLTKRAMLESILFPSAGISHNYENWLVARDDGQVTSGILISESESELQLKDEKGIMHKIPLDAIEQKQKQTTSLMPEGLHSLMSEQELVDLVDYLVQLKKMER